MIFFLSAVAFPVAININERAKMANKIKLALVRTLP